MEKFINPRSLLEKLNSKVPPKVIDVRSPEEYEQGHVPDALNIPIDQLTERILEIPMDQPIITYCNMHHPGQSRGEKAQHLLSEKGFNVQAIEGGFNEWSRLKLPTKSEK
ncbi:rhodanese-like domain-containing protein [Paenibacillus puerhi]|uniref:rhodanese-like domain-containing protein n=1 Tax=Paenibacillus puerhi TaxID=2692622 RepID=UPI001359DD11|nr:rhodanese-like domain-containing protein [Paenibacillus puerhi]